MGTLEQFEQHETPDLLETAAMHVEVLLRKS